MCRVRVIPVALLLAILVGCGHVAKSDVELVPLAVPLTGEAAILQTWTGDFPAKRLDRLPADQREQGVGYIAHQDVFEGVWTLFKPGEALPDIDFEKQLVLFARNTRYFNRILIGKVMVKEGTAELLAMETLSALPIEDKVAMALVVVARKGLNGLRTGATVIPIK